MYIVLHYKKLNLNEVSILLFCEMHVPLLDQFLSLIHLATTQHHQLGFDARTHRTLRESASLQ